MSLFLVLLATALVVARWFSRETPNLSLLVLLIFALGLSLFHTQRDISTQPDTNQVPRISATQAFEAVNSGKAVLLDVRSATSYGAAHLVGSINLSFSELRNRLNEVPTGKQIVCYCS